MRDARIRLAPVLMALSGAAALAYETVWLRMLARTFGVTVYAVAGLVALYMGGLALGAAWSARQRGPADWLRRYAWLEAGAAASSLAATWWLMRLPQVVAALSTGAPLPAGLRLALAAPALLPPTVLLGATLPALARDGADAARLYGANTLGAMAGLLVCALVTIGAWGGDGHDRGRGRSQLRGRRRGAAALAAAQEPRGAPVRARRGRRAAGAGSLRPLGLLRDGLRGPLVSGAHPPGRKLDLRLRAAAGRVSRRPRPGQLSAP